MPLPSWAHGQLPQRGEVHRDSPSRSARERARGRGTQIWPRHSSLKAFWASHSSRAPVRVRDPWHWVPGLLFRSCGLCCDEPLPPSLSHPCSCDKTPWGVDLGRVFPAPSAGPGGLGAASLTSQVHPHQHHLVAASSLDHHPASRHPKGTPVGLAYLNEHLMSELSSIYQAVWRRTPRAHRPTIHVWMCIPPCGGRRPSKAVLVFLRCVGGPCIYPPASLTSLDSRWRCTPPLCSS